MSMPIRYLSQLEEKQSINLNNPPHKIEFQVVEDDQSAREWRFVCTRRTIGYKKPAIAGQWLQFVKFHHIQINDTVIFLHNSPSHHGVPFRIRFERQAP
uniref:TF-B3 domain-containing protein n=1 Tax=Chenopodium quinoa TaxID=63459 RepID=A0A803LWY1_CHEQI